jgi:hypothetical protein
MTDDALLARTKTLAGRERDATAELIAHLAELETRSLHLAAGYGSMFAYCRDALSLSEHEAYNRIEAARAARRFPLVLERLAQGTVNLTTVRLLAPHLTPGNHVEVLESARGLRKPQVEELVARLMPRADVPASIRKLPAPKPAVAPGGAPAAPLLVPLQTIPPALALDAVTPIAPAAPSAAATVFPRPARAAVVSALSPDHPYADGGPPTIDNIELRCRPHNAYESREPRWRGSEWLPASAP